MNVVVYQVIQANGFSDVEPQFVTGISTETHKNITAILEIANRIRRHRFGTTLTVSDINEALISRNSKPLIGYNSSYNVYDYVPIGINHGKEILAVDEPQISLSKFEKVDLPEYPKQVSFDFHWLAYKGIQPKTQENITDFPSDFIPDDSSLKAPTQTELSDQSISFLNSSYQLPQQLFNFFNLSVTADITSEQFGSVLSDIGQHQAVQPLIPLYMRYFRKMLLTNPSVNMITRIIKIIYYLLLNQTLNLDPYIQNFTSIILTIYLSPNNSIEQYHLIENIVARYNDNDFKLKIAENLANYVFSSSPSLTSKFGALNGIQELGLEVFKLYLLPNLTQILNDLKVQINDTNESYETRLQVSKLKNLLFQMCVKAFNGEAQPITKSIEDLYSSVAQHFGYDSFYVFAHFPTK